MPDPVTIKCTCGESNEVAMITKLKGKGVLLPTAMVCTSCLGIVDVVDIVAKAKRADNA